MPPSDPSERLSRRVCVGAIAGAYGVRGEARLKPFTAEPDAIAAYGPVETEDGSERFTITLTGAIKGGVSARLSGIATREQAQALKGRRLYIPREALPEPVDEDEYYHADLVGLRVVDLAGETLGVVRAVLNHGAGDLLEIETPRPDRREADGAGGREAGSRRSPPGSSAPRRALLPFTRQAVPHVSLATGEIVADPPTGLFDDDDEEAPPEGADRNG